MLSVIIPAHNEEKYIAKTLHSLKEQTYRQFEIIVVLNGCTDKTREIVQKHKSVITIELANANVSAARNAGAREAKGEILIFLDADTQLARDTLKVVQDTFTPECSVATFIGKPDDPKFKYKFLIGVKNFVHKTRISKSVSGTLVCHKNHFMQIAGYDESLHVREHHVVISKLCRLGKYNILNTIATTSMRRYKKWGVAKQMGYWIIQSLRLAFSGKDKQEYEKVR